MIGRTFGRYRIVEEIGAGGMGVVYRAHDERLDRDVAIKVIAAGALEDEAARKRFRKEALALSKLNHPNIATVYDFDTQDGLDFLVMELVAGESLSDRLAAGPLSENETLRLGVQLAEGLAAAHAAGIVHRDLKPGNLLVSADGRLKILDFGLAKFLKSHAATARTMSETDQLPAGTLPYMPPEQLSGGPIDARTDIYAAGAVLYELAVGKRAFADPSGPRLVDAILHQMPLAPTAVNPSVSPALAGVILKALDKDPDRRYQSARELSVDLDRMLKPASAAPAAAPRRRFRPRLPAARWMAGGVAVTAAATAVAVWLMSSGSALSFAPRDWIMVADFDNQTGNALFDRALATAFTVGLEQSAHANVLPRARIAAVLKRMGKPNADRIDETLAREICLRENVKVLVASSINRVGTQYALTARLVDPRSGETLKSYMETASDDGLLGALGDIAEDIRGDLGESLASIGASSRPLPQVTTSSLEALQNYAEGFYLWSQGSHREGVQRYHAAIKLDPDFAMAHAKLGVAYYSHIYNERQLGRMHSEKALALSDRTTERERLLIDATHKQNLGYVSDAAGAYEVYIRSYPDDATARYNYGSLLMRAEQQEAAISQFREVIRMAPDHASAYINLATALKGLNRNAEAIEYYDKGFLLEPDWITSGSLNHEYGFSLYLSGNERKAREVFNVAIAKPPTKGAGLRSLALLELTHGRHREAKAKLEEAILEHTALKRDLSAARDHVHLSVVLDGLGDTVGRARELDKAAALLPQISAQVWMGAVLGTKLARAGAADRAEAIHKTLASAVDPKNSEDRSHLHRLEGEIALARGRHAQAVELMKVAVREDETMMSLEALARAAERAGETDEAIARYEAFIAGRDRAWGWEPQQSWFDAHYALAALHAGRGNTARASQLLDALIAAWKDGDPGLPLIERARTLRAQLASKRTPGA